MADEGQIIRGIDWREAFPFTHIFRSFRIAIHLSKLALGLALLLSVYFGGRILDGLWPVHARAVVGEVAQYQAIANGDDQTTLSAWREQAQKDVDQQYAQTLISFGIDKKLSGETDDAFNARVLDDAHNARYMDEVHNQIVKNREDAVANAQKQYGAAEKKSTSTTDDGASRLRARDQAIVDAYSTAEAQWKGVKIIKGVGLFSAFFEYEIRQVNGVVDGVRRNNWLETDGVKDSVYNFFAVGPVWLIWNHTVFFIVFAILFLLSWALFGGAISRIAAVHVARDEKISVRQAMNFAVGKLLSFASAPVIPLVIVIVIGLFLSLVALIGNIPFLGPLAIGAMFVLALLAGFVMTLVLLGTAGGFNLMYPTIAVEGSDSFDAISRSFSYIYARPWRMLFYTTVAVIYGAATYLFVHMFIWLTLVLTHHFVGMGIFTAADNTKDLFSTMWPNPMTTGRLSYSADYETLAAGQRIGAFFMNCWVMLLVSFLGAFAISLYFSANTIVYYLMRSEVDSTEMDDVYLEQSEEEMEPALSGASATVTVTTETTDAAPADSNPPPGDSAPA
ncbi:MAG TPA: hypothetical protein VHX86_02585 [Tepidisphaeraceae bacterium]|jgi:hypothetical protein|nr:hypothetical protein [Tepidisphaeraceae bacterium]